MTSVRKELYNELDAERDYADDKWGGPEADDKNTEQNWVDYIDEWSKGRNRAAGHDFRARMLKTATLAIAAIESHDRKNPG